MAKPGLLALSHWPVRIPRDPFTRRQLWIRGHQSWGIGSITTQRNGAACGSRPTRTFTLTKHVSGQFHIVKHIRTRLAWSDSRQGCRWTWENAAHWELCQVEWLPERSLLLDNGKQGANSRLQAILHSMGRGCHWTLLVVHWLAKESCRSSHIFVWRALVPTRFYHFCLMHSDLSNASIWA